MVDALGRYRAPDRWPRARGPLTDCGAIYYSRYFRLAEGASHHEGSWLLNPRGDLGYGLQHFRGDNRTFAVIFLVPAHDRELRVLRREAAWTAAAAAIRPLDAMTSAQVAQPLTGVMPMGGLSNVLRTGDPGVWRMVAVGDALCHTNPSYAFGLAFALIHASALGRAASAATDGDSLVQAYYEAITPEARERFAFACDTDAARVRAWKGERLDVGRADGCSLFAFGPALAAAPHDDHVLRRTIGRIGLLERTSAFDEDHELHHRAHLRRAHRHAGYAAGTAARGAAGPGRGGLAFARRVNGGDGRVSSPRPAIAVFAWIGRGCSAGRSGRRADEAPSVRQAFVCAVRSGCAGGRQASLRRRAA